METQKSLFRRLLDVALLAGMALALVWVLSLALAAAPEQATQPAVQPAAALAVESPYPPPPTATSPPAPTATPPPYPPPGNAPEPSPTPNYCIGIGQWLTFTDPVAGYTISYPGEALFHANNDPQLGYVYTSFSFNVLTSCYNVGCSGLNGIGLIVYHNPEGLALQPFIEQTFELYGSPVTPLLLTNYEETGYHTRVGVNEDIRAFRVEAGVTLDGGPDIFIANEDRVLLIGASRTSKGMGPFGSPCIKTLEILDYMLDTLVLTTPSQ